MNDGKIFFAIRRLRMTLAWRSLSGTMLIMGDGVSGAANPSERNVDLTYRTFSSKRRRKPGSDLKISIARRAATASGKGSGVLPANIALAASIFRRKAAVPRIAPP